jgi:uncharacterized membrane protein YccF (DUF307 family)
MNILLRTLWFATVGWICGLVWFATAILFSATIVLLPLGMWMANRTWAVATLKTKPN